MKLFDKIKDLFTDEIIEEREEIVEVKKEDKLPSVMREEKNEDIKLEESITDNELFSNFKNIELDDNSSNTVNNFRFPISFEENDFLDDKVLSNQNVMFREKESNVPSVSETYKTKEEKVSLFKVSPVISPVYGILDKNYKKDEVQSKIKTSKDISRSNQKVDFESVRKKAYGSLIDDIKDNLSSVKVEESKDEKEDLYQLKENIDEITFGDIESNFMDFGITMEDYKKDESKDDLVEIKVSEEKDTKLEINSPIIDSKKQEEDFLKDELSDNIFDLIDNMYDDKEDKND